MIRYLCLDNALAITGWAVYDNHTLFDHGIFKTKATDPIEKRLCKIIDFLDTLHINFQFDMLLFEDCQQQSNKNVQTYQKLSMVKAAILIWCGQANIKYACLAPSHWRKILSQKYNIKWGQKRTDQKQTALQFVEDQFQEKVLEDEADAICLGLAGIIENEKPASAF